MNPTKEQVEAAKKLWGMIAVSDFSEEYLISWVAQRDAEVAAKAVEPWREASSKSLAWIESATRGEEGTDWDDVFEARKLLRDLRDIVDPAAVPAPAQSKPCQCGSPILRWVHHQTPLECGQVYPDSVDGPAPHPHNPKEQDNL